MIITRAMPTQQAAITGVSRRITAGQEIRAGLCRDPGYPYELGWNFGSTTFSNSMATTV
jgi:hypothetical protein